jgi:hypothetical protein
LRLHGAETYFDAIQEWRGRAISFSFYLCFALPRLGPTDLFGGCIQRREETLATASVDEMTG